MCWEEDSTVLAVAVANAIGLLTRACIGGKHVAVRRCTSSLPC